MPQPHEHQESDDDARVFNQLLQDSAASKESRAVSLCSLPSCAPPLHPTTTDLGFKIFDDWGNAEAATLGQNGQSSPSSSHFQQEGLLQIQTPDNRKAVTPQVAERREARHGAEPGNQATSEKQPFPGLRCSSLSSFPTAPTSGFCSSFFRLTALQLGVARIRFVLEYPFSLLRWASIPLLAPLDAFEQLDAEQDIGIAGSNKETRETPKEPENVPTEEKGNTLMQPLLVSEHGVQSAAFHSAAGDQDSSLSSSPSLPSLSSMNVFPNSSSSSSTGETLRPAAAVNTKDTPVVLSPAQRLQFSLSFVGFGLLMLLAVKGWDGFARSYDSLPLYVIVLLGGTLTACTAFLSIAPPPSPSIALSCLRKAFCHCSRPSVVPRFYQLVSPLIAFAACLAWLRLIAAECIALLNSLGIVMGISPCQLSLFRPSFLFASACLPAIVFPVILSFFFSLHSPFVCLLLLSIFPASKAFFCCHCDLLPFGFLFSFFYC